MLPRRPRARRGLPRARQPARDHLPDRDGGAELAAAATIYPRATQHIAQMQALIAQAARARPRLRRPRATSTSPSPPGPPTASSPRLPREAMLPIANDRGNVPDMPGKRRPARLRALAAIGCRRAVLAVSPWGRGPARLAHRVLGDVASRTSARASTSTAAAATWSSRTTSRRSRSRRRDRRAALRAHLDARRHAAATTARR